MKKLLLLSSFILLVLALSGQSRWAFGLEMEGGYGGRADLEEQFFPNPQFGDYYTKSQIKPQAGISAGIWSEFLISHHVGLRLGANYGRWSVLSELENISYNTEDVMVFYGRDRYRQQQSLLRIPLEGKLYFGPADRRTRCFVKIGVQAGYLLSEFNVAEHYSGAIGQSEAFEQRYGEKVDLNAEWMEARRWETAFIGGFGVMMDRATLSVQRSWGLSNKDEYFYNSCCGFGFCDCFLPVSTTNRLAHQLELTSLRFSYRLF